MNNKEKTNNKKLLTGFTMLEMIVAVGVFATVAVLSVSSLLSLINAQKKALALQSVQDNLRFSMEAIARDLRQGDFFYCGATLADFPPVPPPQTLPETRDCTVGGQIITFKNIENKITTYQRKDVAGGNSFIEKAIFNSYSDLNDTNVRDAVGTFNPVTSNDINITLFDLYVTGSDRNDSIEPRITIVLEGIVTIGQETSEFHLQTTVSSLRNLTRD